MIFKDRHDAGRRLAKHLMSYANQPDVIVLGIPRGGVPVGFEIAMALHVPLDIFLSHKLGVPGQEELAFGAIAAGDGRFLDQEIIQAAGISSEEIERITQTTRAKLGERARLYRGNQPPVSVEGRIVILVDDGIATGASVFAAIRALRQMNPKKLVLAAPVAPISTCNWLRTNVDDLVIAYAPDNFYAVGQFYEHFSETTDEAVVLLLRSAAQIVSMKTSRADATTEQPALLPKSGISQQSVSIVAGNATLEGSLTIPDRPLGIVLFAHGSGSSRHSPRNQYVADVLHSKGLATLLFDLLTKEEESVDLRTAEFRFNIPLLGDRLISATEWVKRNQSTQHLPVGYFGASTGAAAALMAAARLSETVGAVVSRGGRPDLAGEALSTVRAPSLLLVGGLDETVITLNRQAFAALKSRVKQLVIVPNATHLFEEPGTLEEVARLASEWLIRYLVPTVPGEMNAVGTVSSLE